jgi:hypothetical protein
MGIISEIVLSKIVEALSKKGVEKDKKPLFTPIVKRSAKLGS